MSILVIAEHNNNEVKVATRQVISAASKIDDNIDVILIGYECDEVSKQLSNCVGVSKVLVVNNEKLKNPLAENFSKIVLSIAKNYSHIIGPASTFGKNILPRISVKLDVAQISDVIKINSEDTFVRPIYAGNALATVKSNDKIKVITIRPTSFDPIPKEGGSGLIETIDFTEEDTSVEFIEREESSSERPELGTARVVVSGGRGLQSAENFKLINEIADKLNAAVGASRAAVDAGYVLSLIHI